MNKTNILLASLILAGCVSSRDVSFSLPIVANDNSVPVFDLRADESIVIEQTSSLSADTDWFFKPDNSIADYIGSRLTSHSKDARVDIHSVSVRTNGFSFRCSISSVVEGANPDNVKTVLSSDTDVNFVREYADEIIKPCLDRHIADIQNAL